MENQDKKVLDLAMEAGRILLDAGAEIFRVEETMKRIAKAYGIEKFNSFVLSTGIFITAENQEGEIYASVKHIPIQSAKLHRIAAVNQLSREIAEGKYTPQEAVLQLERIKTMPEKKTLTKMLAAFLSGFLLYVILTLLQKREKETSKIVVNLIGGFSVSLFSVLFYNMGLGHAPGTILVGSIMPLVPGVSLVNAIRDFAEGNYIGGGVRFLDALMVALGVSLGVGMMYILYFRFTGRIIL